MKIVVVGGGITGCVTAMEMAERGHDVDLYEQSAMLGGSLRDIRLGNEVFFNGCQYLNADSWWVKEIRNASAPGIELTDFPLEYGSFTDFDDNPVTHDDYAHPVFRGSIPNGHDFHAVNGSLGDRLSNYPPQVRKSLIGWVSRFGVLPAELDQSTATSLQIGRIYFMGGDDQSISLKRSNPNADLVLGLPRSVLNPDGPKETACLPVEGYDHFFDGLRYLLEARDVSLFLDAPITPRRDPASSQGALFASRREKIEADIFIWCGNPVPLINAFGHARLQNPAVRMSVLCFHAAGYDRTSAFIPRYIQVFSGNSDITRIFVYSLEGRLKVSIECLGEAPHIDAMLACTQKILSQFDLELSLQYVSSISCKRYILNTLQDVETIQLISGNSRFNRILPGGWEIYGRDAKIDAILSAVSAWEN